MPDATRAAATTHLQRRSWHDYSKRLAQVAVKVSKWVHKLQAYTVQPAEGLVTNAQRALEVRSGGVLAGAVSGLFVDACPPTCVQPACLFHMPSIQLLLPAAGGDQQPHRGGGAGGIRGQVRLRGRRIAGGSHDNGRTCPVSPPSACALLLSTPGHGCLVQGLCMDAASLALLPHPTHRTTPPPASRSMELVARQFPVSSKLLQAYTNYRCSPYLPDIVAIVYNM